MIGVSNHGIRIWVPSRRRRSMLGLEQQEQGNLKNETKTWERTVVTFVEDILLHTTYPGVLDCPMTTVNCRKRAMSAGISQEGILRLSRRLTVKQRIRYQIASEAEQNQSSSASKSLGATTGHSTTKPALSSLLQSSLQSLPCLTWISSHDCYRVAAG